MMPPAGGGVRARQFATISKVVHEQVVSEELGELLEELRPYEESLDHDSDEASLIRVTRRDREKELNVPGELREAQARAAAEAFPVWVEARRTNDFELFRPYLERNVELRREYASCFEVDEPYDALLDDFEPGMKTAEVREVFARLKEGLVPLIAEASEQEIDDSFLPRPTSRSTAQQELEQIVLERFGFREGSWRIDPVEHPFAASIGTSDIRMTTRYPEHEFGGVFAAMHEGGHALYEHNVSQALERTPLCRGTSLALHESQSRMFENLVGRSHAWWTLGLPGGPAAVPAARRRRARRLPPRDQQGAAVADPDRGRRGDLQPAHHPALRARAGADRRHGRRWPICRASGTSGCRSTSASRSRTTRTACSRTCTGRAGRSATSRRTRSAT